MFLKTGRRCRSDAGAEARTSSFTVSTLQYAGWNKSVKLSACLTARHERLFFRRRLDCDKPAEFRLQTKNTGSAENRAQPQPRARAAAVPSTSCISVPSAAPRLVPRAVANPIPQVSQSAYGISITWCLICLHPPHCVGVKGSQRKELQIQSLQIPNCQLQVLAVCRGALSSTVAVLVDLPQVPRRKPAKSSAVSLTRCTHMLLPFMLCGP